MTRRRAWLPTGRPSRRTWTVQTGRNVQSRYALLEPVVLERVEIRSAVCLERGFDLRRGLSRGLVGGCFSYDDVGLGPTVAMESQEQCKPHCDETKLLAWLGTMGTNSKTPQASGLSVPIGGFRVLQQLLSSLLLEPVKRFSIYVIVFIISYFSN